MNYEIEAKYSVVSHEAIRQFLVRGGWVFLGTMQQTDQFFDRPDGAVRNSGGAVRIRQVQWIQLPEEDVVRDNQAEITFKGPLEQTGGQKKRLELQTPVGSPEIMASILAQLGYECKMTLQKRRESYRKDNMRIELDELPVLGKFVEIESHDCDAIETLRQGLGITGSHISCSYAGLIQAYCETHGHDPADATFDALQ